MTVYVSFRIFTRETYVLSQKNLHTNHYKNLAYFVSFRIFTCETYVLSQRILHKNHNKNAFLFYFVEEHGVVCHTCLNIQNVYLKGSSIYYASTLFGMGRGDTFTHLFSKIFVAKAQYGHGQSE